MKGGLVRPPIVNMGDKAKAQFRDDFEATGLMAKNDGFVTEAAAE